MSWHFVERWLQKVYQHSTLIGKFWITFLIVFRIVVVSSVSDRVYSDEQSEFRCNTGQVGCGNICFNQFSPMSHIRFWSFQIIMVSTPTILFMVYSAHQVKSTDKKDTKNTKQQRDRQRAEERQMRRQSLYGGTENNNVAGLRSAAKIGVGNLRGGTSINAVASPRNPTATGAGHVNSGAVISPSGTQKDNKNLQPTSGKNKKFRGLVNSHSAELQAQAQNNQHQSAGGHGPPAVHHHPPTAQKLSKMADEDKQSFMNHFLLYTVSVILRTVIELLFMCLQWYVFGWKVATCYKCVGHPCPNTVDCYVSRPWEKTILLWFMYGVAAISTAMNLVELNYLLSHWVSTRLQTLRERRVALQNKQNSTFGNLTLGNDGIKDKLTSPLLVNRR